MDSTYLSMAGSSSHAFTRVKVAQGSDCVTRMLGVVGVLGSLLCSTEDVSTVHGSVIVYWDYSGDMISPDGAIVDPATTDGSGSDGSTCSAKTLEGFGC